MTTGKFKFIIFIVLVIIIGSVSAIVFKVQRDKMADLLSNPKPGHIYTFEIGTTYFNYYKIKNFTKDSICFYKCNYEGVDGDFITTIKEKKDAFNSETISYDRNYLKKISLEMAKSGETTLFNISEIEE